MIVNLPESRLVEISAVSIKFRCKSCGNSFGVYLDTNFNLPLNYDYCFRCEGKKSFFESKREKSNGYTTI